MSNYAALISPLVLSGSRKSDGTPNDTGTVYAYLPDTTTPGVVYADAAATVQVTQPITLDAGGRIPYATYPDGLYAITPLRLLIQDSDQLTVSDTTFVPASAGNTGLNVTGWTDSTVALAFAKLYASTGGPDGQYQESPGATPRTIQAILRGLQVMPQDFGAAADGLTDDTTAIQAAITQAVALGGRNVFFAPGTYKISAALVVPAAASGVGLIGAGRLCTTISQSAVGLDAIQLASGSSGTTISGLSVSGGITAISATSASLTNILYCSLIGTTDCILLTSSSSTNVVGCALGSGLIAGVVGIAVAGTSGSLYVSNTLFAGANAGGILKGIAWAAAASGALFNIVDCPSLAGAVTPFDLSALSTDPGLTQRGNGVDNLTTNIAASSTPTTYTPKPYYSNLTLNANSTSGTGGILVANPSPALVASQIGRVILFTFINGTGSAVTWTFGANYKL